MNLGFSIFFIAIDYSMSSGFPSNTEQGMYLIDFGALIERPPEDILNDENLYTRQISLTRYITNNEFQLMCMPNTFFVHNQSSRVTIESSNRHFAFTDVSIARVTEYTNDIILAIPPLIQNYLVDSLGRLGVTPDFQNCPRAVLDNLVDFHIRFDNGTIILFGSDLFNHNPSNDSCIPRYIVSEHGSWIYPELFPDVSVAFVENGGMLICESVGDEM